MVYLGIDPGKSGGIALLDPDQIFTCGKVWKPVFVWKMPETERDLFDLFKNHEPGGADLAMIERVHAMPKNGSVSGFKLGYSYGLLRMVLSAFRIPFDEVTPAKWQRALGCLSKGDKRVTKQKAQQLFPSINVTHAIADALLIAEYGRRVSLKVEPQDKAADAREAAGSNTTRRRDDERK